MKYRILFISLFLFLNIPFLFGEVVSGTITDENGAPLPFASVYVKNSTTGVSANFEGKYFLELQAGNYLLIYSYTGFLSQEKEIHIKTKQNIIVNVTLLIDISAIDEVEIYADKIDKAKQIMKKVRENRKIYLNAFKSLECNIYFKSSYEKQYLTKDTLKDENKEIKSIYEYLKKDKLNLIEYIADIYYEKPNKYKENIIAYHNFSKQRAPGRSITISVGMENEEIIPVQNLLSNPYIYSVENLINTFNFYENAFNLPDLTSQPLKSPISTSYQFLYEYKYIESFIENGSKIFKISVSPKNTVDALFFGNIFIEDSTFALISVDLSVNEQALLRHENFRIIENFKKINQKVYLPKNMEITYTLKDGKRNILGETKIKYENYAINHELPKNIFSNQMQSYSDDAFDKDSVFWSNSRPIALKDEELEFIIKTDSIKKYYESNLFLDKQDSIFNQFHWYTPFIGWGQKNHYKGTEFMIGGIFEQIVPFGVGGYRHKLPLYFNKEFDNGMLLETKEMVDYGFNNKDFKGKIGAGLTYYPKKFVKTFIEIGNTFEMINNYASVEQTFSRSNYMNTKSVEIKQRMEIFNGLFAELSFLYSEQNPITDLKLSKWSEIVFGELNQPVEFERYIKSEIRLKLKYRIKQKYIIQKNQKIIIGKNYPEITFEYKKGIPDIFQSEAAYEYFEIGAEAEQKLAYFGVSRWLINAGIFSNKNNLRLPDYKYFRGSDVFLFSDPLKSFQLLEKTMNTNNSYFHANYIHHFNGFITNKIPLIKHLKISIAGGGGILGIPKQDFFHAELFAGIEKVIRIKKELFRLGIYGVTSDNSFSAADFTLKIGISPFYYYKEKWNY